MSLLIWFTIAFSLCIVFIYEIMVKSIGNSKIPVRSGGRNYAV